MRRSKPSAGCPVLLVCTVLSSWVFHAAGDGPSTVRAEPGKGLFSPAQGPPDSPVARLKLRVPARITEGDGWMPKAGQILISAAVGDPVEVTLASSDSGRLTVPERVVIPSGQTNALFDLDVTDNLLTEGKATVWVRADAEGFSSAQAYVTLADDDVHHLSFGRIPSPQYVGVPLTVTITAEDLNGERVERFTGNAFLSAGSSVGSMELSSSQATAFDRGQWTGLLTLSSPGSHVQLRATLASGASGLSIPFKVESLPVRKIDLQVQDVCYDRISRCLYASVFGSNAVVCLEPVTGTVFSSIPLGEPLGPGAKAGYNSRALAVSEDGRFAFVAVSNGYAIRQVDLQARTLGPRFAAGTEPTYGPLFVLDMFALPGANRTVVVASGIGYYDCRGLAVFDNGISRPSTITYRVTTIEPSGQTNLFYGYNGETTGAQFFRIQVTSAGVSLLDETPGLLSGLHTDMVFDGGRIFSPAGQMLDPQKPELIGRYDIPDTPHLVAPDVALERVFFGGYRVHAAHIGTFTPLKWFDVPINSVEGFPARLVRWGEDGLAVLTSNGRLYLVNSALLIPTGPAANLALTASCDLLPAVAKRPLQLTLNITNAGPDDAYETEVRDTLPANTILTSVAVSQGSHTISGNSVHCQLGFLGHGSSATIGLTLVPTAAGWITNRACAVANERDENLFDNVSTQAVFVGIATAPYGYDQILLPARDLVYSATTDRIYASLGGDSAVAPHSVLPINPLTGTFDIGMPAGKEPGKLALSADQRYLYFVAETNQAIRRWNFPSNRLDLDIRVSAGSLGVYSVEDLEVLADAPESLAVLRAAYGYDSEVIIYDRDQMRPLVAPVFSDRAAERIEVGSNPLRVYAQNDGVRGFARVDVTADGATLLDLHAGLNPLSASVDLEWADGLLLTSYGAVIDPAGPVMLTSVPGIVSPAPVTFDRENGRFFYLTANGANWELKAFDRTTFGLLDSLLITNVIGHPASLIRCGSDRLAFRTTGNQLFIVRLPLADQADLTVSQTALPDPAVLGLDLSLMVQVTNALPVTVPGVTIRNQLPSSARLVGYSASLGSVTVSSNLLLCSLGSLPGGASATLTIVVCPTNLTSGWLTNVAEVVSAVPDPLPTNNVSVEVLAIAGNDDPRPLFLMQTARHVRSGSAELNSWVNPNRADTLVYCEYGLSTNYTGQSQTNPIGHGTSQVQTRLPIVDLLGGREYHFRTVAVNSLGTTCGPDATFSTTLTPDVVTLPPSDVGLEGSTLNAIVNPQGLSTFVHFEYGPTTNYGGLSVDVNAGYQTGNLSISIPISGLISATNYHVRAVATNGAGASLGLDVEFHTPDRFDVSAGGLPGVADGSVAWADYNKDGWMDVLLAGNTGSTGYVAGVYRNNGDGTFTDIGLGLPGLVYAAVAWTDYDGDGELDFLLTGQTGPGARIARIYRNLGNGAFADIDAGLTGVAFGAVAWGDYDQDGRPDLLLAGRTQDWPDTSVCQLFHNGGGSFSNVYAGLPGFYAGSVAWGDFDNDGDLDILLTGWTGNSALARIFRNDGHGVFTDIQAGFPQVSSGWAAWGDHDNDGNLDVLLMGQLSQTSYLLQLYRNNGDGSFSNINTGIPQFAADIVLWGDYDNDGFNDILMTGEKIISSTPDTVNRSLYVFRNDHHGTFTALNLGLPEVWNSTAAWADFDNDGRLDFLVTGNTRNGASARLYRNNTPLANHPPAVPTNLVVDVSSNTAVFRWSAVRDRDSEMSGLNYNLWVGRLGDGEQTVPPLALADGTRLVAQPGNVGAAPSWTLTNLKPASYYWSVQAIDVGFAGSAFAAVERFEIRSPAVIRIVRDGPAAFRLQGSGTPGVTYILESSLNLLQWGPITNLTAGSDGLFEHLETSVIWPSRFYRLYAR